MQALELMLCEEKANSMISSEHYTHGAMNAGQVLQVRSFSAVGRDLRLEEGHQLDAEHTFRVAHWHNHRHTLPGNISWWIPVRNLGNKSDTHKLIWSEKHKYDKTRLQRPKVFAQTSYKALARCGARKQWECKSPLSLTFTRSLTYWLLGTPELAT